ncbi:BPL-N domain-containing protein [Pseudomonas oryzihabitans]|uniref:BPL-N domain-containing protein n=1 Tax=Pseudomonas oryzihabitans TaxID=47885 RepID=UPI00073634D0|nr:BPL-N domain-containing protein [Pseudomonas psychrotolerans]
MRYLGVSLVLLLAFVPAVFGLIDLDEPEVIRIAIYRGPAACEGCAEAIQDAIGRLGPAYQAEFVGPAERRDISSTTLQRYEAYVQPGGGQDIPAALSSLGKDKIAAIRAYVAQGGQYLGICMGAYLADADNLGLLDAELDSEVGRPGFPVTSIDDSAVLMRWGDSEDHLFFQDGPYLPARSGNGFRVIGKYGNGDIAAARYRFGAGVLVLSGPHPEADESWFQEAGLPRRLLPRGEPFKILFDALDL